MARDETMLAIRATQMPIPQVPSTIRQCNACEEDVWISDNILRYADLECSGIKCSTCIVNEQESEKKL